MTDVEQLARERMATFWWSMIDDRPGRLVAEIMRQTGHDRAAAVRVAIREVAWMIAEVAAGRCGGAWPTLDDLTPLLIGLCREAS
jgi:hypothetical protein